MGTSQAGERERGAMKREPSPWRKSSYSGGTGNCVEVASDLRAVAVRDSKDPRGPELVIAPPSWSSFTGRLKTGQKS